MCAEGSELEEVRHGHTAHIFRGEVLISAMNKPSRPIQSEHRVPSPRGMSVFDSKKGLMKWTLRTRRILHAPKYFRAEIPTTQQGIS